MSNPQGKFQLELLGAFRLIGPDGARINVSSRRGRALLAMLATSRTGERSRGWLQDRLWGSRQLSQAQASLRRELSNLRPLLNQPGEGEILVADHDSVHLRLDRMDIDIADNAKVTASTDEFLEGLVLKGENTYFDWRTEMREEIASTRENGPAETAVTAVSVARESGKPSLSIILQGTNPERSEAIMLENVSFILGERLARLRWLALISAPSVFVPRSDMRALQEMSQSLGAGYLLLCHAGPASGLQEVHLSLNEAATNRVLWMVRRPLPMPFTPEILNALAGEVVAALASHIEIDQQMRARDRGPMQNLTVNEKVWRARWHIQRLTREDAQIAADLLEEARKEQPHDATILIEQAFVGAWQLWAGREDTDAIIALRDQIEHARTLDPFDPRVYYLAGICEMWLRRHDIAIPLFERAIELNPSLSGAYGQLGSCHSLGGDPERAIPLLERGLRLNPLDTEAFHQYGELALAKLMLGKYDEAIGHADQAIARRSGYAYAHAIRIAALQQDGRETEADKAREFLRKVKPGFDGSELEWLPFDDPHWNTLLVGAVAGESAM